jgi:carboxypeptidase D
LRTVIEKTNNVIIAHGLLDFVLQPGSSLLALQNLTWNGQQGFSRPLEKAVYVPEYEQRVVAQSGHGKLGRYTEDRGLTFCMVEMAGHQVPGYQPGVAYRQLEKLLGRISSLDDQREGSADTGNNEPVKGGHSTRVFTF